MNSLRFQKGDFLLDQNENGRHGVRPLTEGTGLTVQTITRLWETRRLWLHGFANLVPNLVWAAPTLKRYRFRQ